jgi:hypothetical protein
MHIDDVIAVFNYGETIGSAVDKESNKNNSER